MAVIVDLYFAMLTRPGESAGTNSAVSLLISDQGTDRLNQTFGGTSQEDQEPGQANLYHLNLRSDVRARWIDSSTLVNGDIRVGVLGDDAWRPLKFFLWGVSQISPPPGQRILPLAIETNVSTVLSTTDTGAVPSMSVRLVRTGSPTMLINELLLLVETTPESDPSVWSNLWHFLRHGPSGRIGDPGQPPGSEGTDSPIELRIVADGGLVVQQRIGDTSQDDLEAGQVNWYSVPVAVPFTRAAMGRDSVRLSIDGSDLWLPNSLFLFGFDRRESRPTSVIPLVHLDSWDLGVLSTDSREGSAEVVLPLVPIEVSGGFIGPTL